MALGIEASRATFLKAASFILLAFADTGSARAEPPLTGRPALPQGEEFTKLRMAYAKQENFDPMWKMDPKREELAKAYREKDFTKFATLSKAWLEQVPVDAEIHYVRAQALTNLGEWSGAAYHWHCFYGLIHSIAASGDGKTPETAFKVISVSEEYSLLGEIGAELIQQALKPPCDEMRVKLREGTETTLYFDVSISFNAMQRQLGLKNNKP